jgi:hypothetical protein
MAASQTRGSGTAPLLLAILILVPILYVLSIGPVVAVVEKTGTGREAVVIFYAPVIWLHDNTPLEKPLEKYAEFWGWH